MRISGVPQFSGPSDRTGRRSAGRGGSRIDEVDTMVVTGLIDAAVHPISRGQLVDGSDGPDLQEGEHTRLKEGDVQPFGRSQEALWMNKRDPAHREVMRQRAIGGHKDQIQQEVEDQRQLSGEVPLTLSGWVLCPEGSRFEDNVGGPESKGHWSEGSYSMMRVDKMELPTRFR